MMCVESHEKVCRMGYVVPVFVDVKCLLQFRCLHVAQRGCPQRVVFTLGLVRGSIPAVACVESSSWLSSCM